MKGLSDYTREIKIAAGAAGIYLLTFLTGCGGTAATVAQQSSGGPSYESEVPKMSQRIVRASESTLPYDLMTKSGSKFASGTISVNYTPIGNAATQTMSFLEAMSDVLGDTPEGRRYGRDLIRQQLTEWTDGVTTLVPPTPNTEVCGAPCSPTDGMRVDHKNNKIYFYVISPTSPTGVTIMPSLGFTLTQSHWERFNGIYEQYLNNFFLLKNADGSYVNQSIFNAGASPFHLTEDSPVSMDWQERNIIYQNKMRAKFNSFVNRKLARERAPKLYRAYWKV